MAQPRNRLLLGYERTPAHEAPQRLGRLRLGDDDPGHDQGAAAPAERAEAVAREPEAEDAGEDRLHRERDRSAEALIRRWAQVWTRKPSALAKIPVTRSAYHTVHPLGS